eukprot:CAMPEP_0197074090 /NCGR_PEP_ID=MMETSP1384-20130603/210934_1 /TAXON_ID=29189 /ORGANISM="Ammonia sp." /LENGTH=946 /DNA_ID=CAMNT_0042512931 /DNA_START=16 /DNA_END=2857 /DNA_ORIENTATION=-
MTLAEKVQNLQSTNPGVTRLGVPSNLFHEALHGVVCGCGETYENNTGCPTSFPHALLLGATFNRSLWREVGSAISTEARAFANQGIVGLFFWAPDINLFRDPRWGRGQEVPGEDPFLTGQYVMEYSYHMQNGEDTKYMKVVSTAKHYADYDQEGNYGTDRGSFDANVTMQDQVEYYWPAWRTAIQTAKVQSIMCSYNAVNSMPSCGNDYFMNQVARDEWGFDGFFVSDCGAIGDGAFTRYIQQTYPDDSQTVQQYEQAKQAITAGCDTNCGSYYAQHLYDSVVNGYASEDDVDRASRRLWSKTIELGKLDFNPPSYYTTYGADKIDSSMHRSIALSAAEQGIVLLKNDGILPISTANANGKSIALIGPHANATKDMLSIYVGSNTLVYSNSPYDAFAAYGKYQITYNLGCDYNCNSTAGFDAAVSSAKAADYAVVFLGLHPLHCQQESNAGAACEDEGWDRNTIDLPANQTLLLQQVYAANKNTVLVLINGGAVNISWAKSNIPAIIEAFYPGELGGVAIRNVIYGDTAPAGKLPVTIYDASLMQSRPSIMDMSLRNTACEDEGWDRNTIDLPANQTLLLQQVYAANKNTVLVLINGGAVNISWAKSNIPAIIEAFYPGELGGVAIRNVIYGDTAPAGKLPVTIYDASFMQSRPSIMDMSLRNNGGITYRYYTGTPLYPFGFGLYYTNFTYKYYNASSSSSEIGGERVVETKTLADFYRNGYYFYRSSAASFVVQVTNIGARASDCVVLGFVTSENDPDAPLIKLFDFQRVYVEKGESVNVTLSITPEAISVTNQQGNERIVPGRYNLLMGDYQNDNYVHVKMKLVGEEVSLSAASFVVEVANIGGRASDCVVLGFVTSENDPDAPLIKLFDFQRVYVEKGESVNVTLSITPEAISVTNQQGNERIVPGRYNLLMGDYQNDNYVHVKMKLVGKEESIFNLQKIKQR